MTTTLKNSIPRSICKPFSEVENGKEFFVLPESEKNSIIEISGEPLLAKEGPCRARILVENPYTQFIHPDTAVVELGALEEIFAGEGRREETGISGP